MTYRMSESPYLSPDLPPEQRAPIEPFASYATGANEMSPIDMAAGIQTLANGGVHKEPYYVEHIDDAQGKRVYTHEDEGTRVLDRGCPRPRGCRPTRTRAPACSTARSRWRRSTS